MQTQPARTPCLPCILLTALATLSALVAAGCATGPASTATTAKPAMVAAIEPWQFRDKTASAVRTQHYSIYTTIDDREFLGNLSMLMESALVQYKRFTPSLVANTDSMDCYMFAKRPEWQEFTRAKTGADAALYLQINKGGYTVRDWFVAYYITGNEAATYAVAAHEGWHQFVARNFKSRLPPFLEEGIATMFENVRFDSPQSPRWDLTARSPRSLKLRVAIETESLFPLDKLVTMHAGEVVGMPGPRIEAFYAQSWAFAEFLWNGDDGKYRPAFQRLLGDCANGTVRPQAIARRSVLDSWNPQSVKPMLESYLCMPLEDIDKAYQAYIRQVAYRTADIYVN